MRDLREEIRRRLAAARLEPTREAEIVDELAQHLEDRVADLLAGGAAPAEAERLALAELDDHETLVRELRRTHARAQEPVVAGAPRRGLAADLLGDLRYGVRALVHSPGFTLVTLLSLALGIGANAAIFQLLDTLHLRALPVAEPAELAQVRIVDPRGRRGGFSGWHPDVTYPIWEQLRAQQQAFSGIAAWGDTTVNLAPSGRARWARGLMVSGDFFHVLGVRPLLGRVLGAADDARGCAPAAVVSQGFWERELGGDPGAIGRALSIDGHAVTIIGVTPAWFFGMEVGRAFDIAMPLCIDDTFRGAYSRLDRRHAWWLSVVGRLQPGWNVQRAGAQLAAISPAVLDVTVPPSFEPPDVARYRAFRFGAYPAGHGISELRADYSTPLYFLLAIAGLVLLIACANLANLLLARGSARERELAVRLALGASPGRLIRQLMVESLLLAVAGAALALGLARWLSQFLVAYLETRTSQLSMDLSPDWRVFAFTGGLAALTCVLFGLAPALRAARTDVGLVLKSAGRAGDSPGRLGLRRVLVVTQVALSLVLLVGALLFTRSFQKLVTVDTGFDAEGLVVANLDLRALDLPDDRLAPLGAELLQAVRDTPGVASAATASIVPLSGDSWNNDVWLDGVEPRKETDAWFSNVTPGYFATLGTPLRAGRDFGAVDGPGAPRVAIINRALAEKLGIEGDAVGRLLRRESGTGHPEQSYRIIGLVEDSKYLELREPRRPLVFLHVAQDPHQEPFASLLVRGAGRPADTIAAVNRAIERVASAASVDYDLVTTLMRDSLLRERLMATLSSAFGILAALLATIGLYGVISYSVARRTHEIGIRVALGATRRDITRMVLGDALQLLAAGTAAGLLLAFLATRAVRALLYGLAPHDPLTFALAVLFMAVVTCLAALLPARRAARVEPVIALRDE